MVILVFQNYDILDPILVIGVEEGIIIALFSIFKSLCNCKVGFKSSHNKS